MERLYLLPSSLCGRDGPEKRVMDQSRKSVRSDRTIPSRDRVRSDVAWLECSTSAQESSRCAWIEKLTSSLPE